MYDHERRACNTDPKYRTAEQQQIVDKLTRAGNQEAKNLDFKASGKRTGW